MTVTALKSSLDSLLLRTQKVQAIEGPSRRYQNSLYNCIHVEQNIMRSGTEEQWIRRSDDLASIAGDAENGWLSAVVEDSIRTVSKSILLVSRCFFPRKRTYG